MEENVCCIMLYFFKLKINCLFYRNLGPTLSKFKIKSKNYNISIEKRVNYLLCTLFSVRMLFFRLVNILSVPSPPHYSVVPNSIVVIQPCGKLRPYYALLHEWPYYQNKALAIFKHHRAHAQS